MPIPDEIKLVSEQPRDRALLRALDSTILDDQFCRQLDGSRD